ncbi:hypothetical protein C1645_770679 [Glomus cerebriforme]|uniref:Uncharacterized protein n=1 Tax=Glomus cerebriforme TaxID=658196 RepID=A0A397SVU5_9GLOM|nr:hypothetical protein C1645_770679 [Glomus cerebriforme]
MSTPDKYESLTINLIRLEAEIKRKKRNRRISLFFAITILIITTVFIIYSSDDELTRQISLVLASVVNLILTFERFLSLKQ